MKLNFLGAQMLTRRALLALAAVTAMGVGVRQAFASTGCVEACVSAFGVSFYNSAGDYFVLTDCATSELGTGRVYCTYSRLQAMQ